MPMTRGSTPAWLYATNRPIGSSPWRCAYPESASTTAAAASLTPAALPAVTVPSSAKADRNFGEVLHRDTGPDVFVERDLDRPLLAPHVDRGDLLDEVAGLDCGGGPTVALHR